MADRKVTTSLVRSITFSLAASLLLMAQASTARADHASCMEKAKSYFAEIDQLLSKEKNWIMPFVELNERYSPLEDCDTDLLLQEATRWRFIQPIIYNSHAKYYLVRFWSDDVKVEFSFQCPGEKVRYSQRWMGEQVATQSSRRSRPAGCLLHPGRLAHCSDSVGPQHHHRVDWRRRVVGN
jgi:hypothetical protein